MNMADLMMGGAQQQQLDFEEYDPVSAQEYFDQQNQQQEEEEYGEEGDCSTTSFINHPNAQEDNSQLFGLAEQQETGGSGGAAHFGGELSDSEVSDEGEDDGQEEGEEDDELAYSTNNPHS